MKTLTRIAFFTLFLAFVNGLSAQTNDKTNIETKTYSVKVFFHCANGKALLEKELPKKRGVISAIANLETKMVDVVYDPTLTKPETIVEYIHQIGYLTADSPEGTKLNKACDHDGESTH